MIGNRKLQVNRKSEGWKYKFPFTTSVIGEESDTLCSNNTAKMGIFKHVISAPKYTLRVYILSSSLIQ